LKSTKDLLGGNQAHATHLVLSGSHNLLEHLRECQGDNSAIGEPRCDTEKSPSLPTCRTPLALTNSGSARAQKQLRPDALATLQVNVWISFGPQSGREQAGHRPAVVLSPAAFNAKTSLMVCCPMTTQIKNYPFEVEVAGGSPSAVLTDQVKSLDRLKRRAKRKGTIAG
jgi:mRNA interferase MazF